MGNEVSSFKNQSLTFKSLDFGKYNFNDDSAISLLVTTLTASISPPIKCISIQQCLMETLPPLKIIEQSFGFSDLRTCYICENQISELPNDFTKFIALKELSLSSNKFNTFDQILYSLSKLQRISLDKNEISGSFPPTVPANLQCLLYSSLLSLDLSYNRITSISPDISKFLLLEQLNLSNNQLKVFPKQVCDLKKLRVLDLSHNNIKEIPPQIVALESLIILKIHNNQLTKISNEINSLNLLSELTIYSNNLDMESDSIKTLLSSINVIAETNFDQGKVSKVAEAKKKLNTKPQSNSNSPKILRESLRPNIGEFEIAFKSVLASFDDNDKIKLQMKKLSLEEKWLLLQQRGKKSKATSPVASRSRSNTNNNNNNNNNKGEDDETQQMIIENHMKLQRNEDLEEEEQLSEQITTKLFAISEEAPITRDCKYFITQLKGNISLNDTSLLYEELLNNTEEYLNEFIKLGGSTLLLSKLKQYIDMEDSFSEQEEYNQFELLKCYNIVFQSRSAEIVNQITESGKKKVNKKEEKIENDALRIVAANGGWKKAQSNEQSIHLQILSLQILLSAARVDHPNAVALVIDAFDFVKTHINTDESRFQNLLIALSEDPNIDEHLRESLQSTALSLINGLIDGTNELKSRCSLRKELLQLNLEQKLGDLKGQKKNGEFSEVLSEFLESMDDDFEEVLVRDGIEEMLKLRPTLAPRPPDHLLVLPLVTGCVSATPIIIPFDENTLVSHVVDHLKQNLSFKDENFDCSLYFPKINGGIWAENLNEKISSFNLSGEVITEYKYKPWSVQLVYIDHNDQQHSKIVDGVDPNSVINDSLSRFLKIIFPNDASKNIEEFGLFISNNGFLKLDNIGNNKNGDFLIPSNRFTQYKRNLNIKEKLIYIKEKFITVNFNISEGIQEVIEIDSSITAQELFNNLVQKVNIPPTNILQYQLYIERRGRPDDDLMNLDNINNINFDHISNNNNSPLSLRGFGMGGHRAPENIKRYSIILTPIYRIPMDHSLKLRTFKITHEDVLVIALTPAEARLRANRRTIYLNKDDHLPPLSPSSGKRATILTKKIQRQGVSISDSDSVRKQLLLQLESEFVEIQFANVIDIRNIWEEPLDGNMEIKNGAVRAATLNQLVTLLTEPHDDFDRKFADAFFTTCPTFCTPIQLVAKIFERYEPDESACADSEAKKLIRMRVLLAIGTWIDHNPQLFISKIISPIHLFFELCSYDGYSEMINSMKQKALLAANVKNPLLSLPKGGPQVKVSFMDIDPLEIAKQICLKTYAQFSEIKSEELVGQTWSKSDGKSRAPNVIKSIDNFNYFSRWVSSLILQQEKVRNRAKVFSKLIEIAVKLLSLNNFQILMSFISGFNVCAVSRLKWTQAKLHKQSRKALTRLEQIMSMEGSFRNYRDLISKSEPPGIPYLGVYLQDITFIEDGNLDYIVAHMINFEKRLMLYDVISKIRRFQKLDYRFKPTPAIIQILDTCSIQSDEELYRISLLREPRNATRSDID